MFTGIIQAVGTVAGVQSSEGSLRVRIQTNSLDLSDVSLGDSIATNGVCLTVVELPGDGFRADVSGESISRTTLGRWKVGEAVNLEKALTLQTPLGGHLVSGHVDGLGVIESRIIDGNSVRFKVRAPDQLARYIAEKGSITVDGVSLTVNKIDGAVFELNIVPHSVARTILDTYKIGARVNLEVDVIARYLERLLLGNIAPQGGAIGLTETFLAEHGFSGRAV